MKAILFDLDDTLHDKSSTLQCMAKRQFSEFSLADMGVDVQYWTKSYLQHHNELIPKTEVFELLKNEFELSRAIYLQLLKDYDMECGRRAQPFPGLHQLLTACKERSVLLGCVTNGRDEHQRSKLEGLKISLFFDSIVTSGELGVKKPDPLIFNTCLAELGVGAKDSVMIGDNYNADMVPAMNLGMRIIWKSQQKSEDVDFCSYSLHEIRSYLFD